MTPATTTLTNKSRRSHPAVVRAALQLKNLAKKLLRKNSKIEHSKRVEQ